MNEFSPNTEATQPRVALVLFSLLAAVSAMALFGLVLYQALATGLGWEISLSNGGIPSNPTSSDLWQIRVLLALNHLTMFVAAGTLVVWFWYRTRGFQYLWANHWPHLDTLGYSILLMVVATPLVLGVYSLNKALPLPEALRSAEDQTNAALKALMNMATPAEFWANLLLIGLLPAVGEELIFRGILQRQFHRIMGPLAAILLAAAIFSFIHLQFEGFFPRMLLGALLGWLYWETKSFWAPMMAHFFNNGIQVVAQYMYGNKLSSINLEDEVNVPWYVVVGSAALTIGLMMYRVQNRRAA